MQKLVSWNIKKNLLQWLKRDDIIWVSIDDLLCKVKHPQSVGRSGSMMKLDEKDINKIKTKYSKLISIARYIGSAE
jgi:uncharacterized membrane protein